MNAGAYGGEMKQVVETRRVLTPAGETLDIPVSELGMSYRDQCDRQKRLVVLEAVLKLNRGRKEDIRARMDELKERGCQTASEYGSAGSTFKRPEGYFAES